jgi:hypothetical protein
MAYVVTQFSKYHSNILGSVTERNHPDLAILSDGRKIWINYEKREEVIVKNWESDKKVKYHDLGGVEFKVVSEYDNDCDRSGSTIRWKIPKGTKLVWLVYNDEEEKYTNIITKEQIV